MTSIARDGGGSFRDLRERHLPLFDLADGRHDRGWPHAPADAREASAKKRARRPQKHWTIVDILHFRSQQDDD